MRIEKGFQPSCSEVVFRFNNVEFRVDTSDNTTSFINEIFEMIKSEKRHGVSYKKIKGLKMYALENIGGGGDFDYLAHVIYMIIEKVYKDKEVDIYNTFINYDSENKKELIEIEYKKEK